MEFQNNCTWFIRSEKQVLRTASFVNNWELKSPVTDSRLSIIRGEVAKTKVQRATAFNFTRTRLWKTKRKLHFRKSFCLVLLYPTVTVHFKIFVRDE